MVRFAVRWPGRRKAWTAASGAVAFVLASSMVLSLPGPPPPPPLVSQREVVSTPGSSPTTSLSSATPSPTTSPARPVTITATPPDAKRGITVYATPLGDGTLSMTETVRFDRPQTKLTLSPPKVASAPAVFRDLVPTVSQIELTVDGQDLQIKSRTLTAPLVVLLAPAGAMRVDVRYLLDHVVAAVPGGTTASTALVAPLIDGTIDALNVSYVIGAQINSYGCPQLTTTTARADCQGLARASTSPVGLISGLPSAIALLVIGLPPGTAIPSPSDSPPSSGSSAPPTPPTSASPSPSPSPSPPSPPTTPTNPAPPPPAPSTPPPTTDPPPSDTPPAPPTTDPVPTPPPTPPPTPTETATLPPPTGGTAGGNGATTPPAVPAAPAAVSPAAASGASGAASQVGNKAEVAVQGATTGAPVVLSLPTPAG